MTLFKSSCLVVVALVIFAIHWHFDLIASFAPSEGLIHPLFEPFPIWQTSKYAQSLLPLPELPNVYRLLPLSLLQCWLPLALSDAPLLTINAIWQTLKSPAAFQLARDA